MTKECTDTILRAIGSCLKSPAAKVKVFEALMRYECTGEHPPDIEKWRGAKAAFTCCIEIIALHEKAAKNQRENKQKAGLASAEARAQKEDETAEECSVEVVEDTSEQGATDTNREREPHYTLSNNSSIYNSDNFIIENTRARDLRQYLCNKLVQIDVTDPPGTPESALISTFLWKWCNYMMQRKKEAVTDIFIESTIMSLYRWYKKDVELWKACIDYLIANQKPGLYQIALKELRTYEQNTNGKSNTYFKQQRDDSNAAKADVVADLARHSAKSSANNTGGT